MKNGIFNNSKLSTSNKNVENKDTKTLLTNIIGICFAFIIYRLIVIRIPLLLYSYRPIDENDVVQVGNFLIAKYIIVISVICLILSFIPLKLKYNRVRIAKLANRITWGIVIICALITTKDILFNSGRRNDILLGDYFYLHIYDYIRLILLILLIVNLISIDNKIKAVILSASQFSMMLIAPVVIFLVFLLIISGGAGALNGLAGGSSDSTGYSYDQNTEARNKGYSNALEAERSGRKWNGSTWE